MGNETLVCECLDKREFIACLLGLRKHGVTWSGGKVLNIEDSLEKCYFNQNIDKVYIFLEKVQRFNQDLFIISFLSTWDGYTSYYQEIKLGKCSINEENLYVVDIVTFLKLVNFYFKNEKIKEFQNRICYVPKYNWRQKIVYDTATETYLY